MSTTISLIGSISTQDYNEFFRDLNVSLMFILIIHNITDFLLNTHAATPLFLTDQFHDNIYL